MQIVKAFKKVSGKVIPYKIRPRRNVDIANCWADTEIAKQLLNWKASCSLDQMSIDGWRWQLNVAAPSHSQGCDLNEHV